MKTELFGPVSQCQGLISCKIILQHPGKLCIIERERECNQLTQSTVLNPNNRTAVVIIAIHFTIIYSMVQHVIQVYLYGSLKEVLILVVLVKSTPVLNTMYSLHFFCNSYFTFCH